MSPLQSVPCTSEWKVKWGSTSSRVLRGYWGRRASGSKDAAHRCLRVCWEHVQGRRDLEGLRFKWDVGPRV